MKYEIVFNGKQRAVEIVPTRANSSHVTVTIDGRRLDADAVKIAPSVYSVILDGRSFEVRAETAREALVLRIADSEYRMEIANPRAWRRGRGAGTSTSGPQQLTAPMAGKVVRVLVAQGEKVELGQGLLVVEAMKMQNEIRAPRAGTVERLHAKPGQSVSSGEILAVIA
jgi:biotin carboxyl carrier protein